MFINIYLYIYTVKGGFSIEKYKYLFRNRILLMGYKGISGIGKYGLILKNSKNQNLNECSAIKRKMVVSVVN